MLLWLLVIAFKDETSIGQADMPYAQEVLSKFHIILILIYRRTRILVRTILFLDQTEFQIKCMLMYALIIIKLA